MTKFLTKDSLKLMDSYIINIVLLCIYLRALLFENIFVVNLVFALPLSYLAIRNYIWAKLIIALWVSARLINWIYNHNANLNELGLLIVTLIILLPQIYCSLNYMLKSKNKNIVLLKNLLTSHTNGTTFFMDITVAFVLALLGFLLVNRSL